VPNLNLPLRIGHTRLWPKTRPAASLSSLLVAANLLLGVGCTLPSLEARPTMLSLSDTSETRLGNAVITLGRAHPGKSGVYPLAGAEDAFAARIGLAAAAERSIDAQYYIWHDDVTGKLLFDALCKAADRGVRVRLLLDDNSTAGLDPTIAALAAHPNIYVRLFNPMRNRRARWTNYLFDFSRLNHRMHNKSFTVDEQVTVIGGRNIGDEYFDAGVTVAFTDLDVIAIGPVVSEASYSFDRFWNSSSAYPAQTIVPSISLEQRVQLRTALAATGAEPAAKSYLQAVRHSELVAQLQERRLSFEWVDVKLVSDSPVKVFSASREVLLLPQLLELAGPPSSQFDVISPYLVPGEVGTAHLTALARRGVHIRVLTNSLASNDVAAVHAGYAKRRKDLLRSGIMVYELKPRLSATGPAPEHSSSSAALHAKTFQIDGVHAFVGSFNFDPRSAKLNTELGLVIESPALARQLQSFFDTQVPRLAYQVELEKSDKLEWSETTAGGRTVYGDEPGASAWRRTMVGFLSVLPIEWLL